MLAILALFCISTAYFVSTVPVGVKLCHVLCDKDCSCSSPSYDSKHLICELSSSKSPPSKCKGMVCPSGSCRMVHSRRGAVLCVKNTALKSMIHRFRMSDAEKMILLSGKGVSLESVKKIVVKLKDFRTLDFGFTSYGRCRPIIKIQYSISSSKFQVQIHNVGCTMTIFKRRKRVKLDKCYVTITFNRPLKICVKPHSNPYPCIFRKAFEPDFKLKDLAIMGTGLRIIIEVYVK